MGFLLAISLYPPSVVSGRSMSPQSLSDSRTRNRNFPVVFGGLEVHYGSVILGENPRTVFDWLTE